MCNVNTKATGTLFIIFLDTRGYCDSGDSLRGTSGLPFLMTLVFCIVLCLTKNQFSHHIILPSKETEKLHEKFIWENISFED